MKDDLKKAILRSIAFFDLFNYPMTELEVYKWLWKHQATLFQVQEELEELIKERRIAFKDGLFFLLGKENSVDERKEKYLIADKKYKKAIKVIKFLQIIPFVEFIGICNTLLILDFKEESDIDVFIIVKKGRLWMTRFAVTFLTAILGSWRHGRRVKDKVCLSFYITDDALNLRKIALKGEDPYLVYWISFIVPLLDRGVYHKFLEKNKWVKEFIPQFIPYGSITRRRKIIEVRTINVFRVKIEKTLMTKFGDHLEQFFRLIQKKKMEKREKSRNEENSGVIISDQMLKFHEIDRKKEYLERWERNLKNI